MIASWQEINDKKKKKKKACWKAKKQNIACQKGLDSQGYGLSSSHIWLWELNHKEIRVLKNWCLRTVVSENTLESPFDSKEIKLVNLKGNQLWILVGRTGAEAETPVFWSSDANSWLIGKVPDAGKDWGQKKRASEDGWLDGILMQWTWTWTNLGRLLPSGGTERPAVLQSMGLQRVGHDWATQQHLTT